VYEYVRIYVGMYLYIYTFIISILFTSDATISIQ